MGTTAHPELRLASSCLEDTKEAEGLESGGASEKTHRFPAGTPSGLVSQLSGFLGRTEVLCIFRDLF